MSLGTRKRRFKEHFTNGINVHDMMPEIIRELRAIKKATEITSKH